MTDSISTRGFSVGIHSRTEQSVATQVLESDVFSHSFNRPIWHGTWTFTILPREQMGLMMMADGELPTHPPCNQKRRSRVWKFLRYREAHVVQLWSKVPSRVPSGVQFCCVVWVRLSSDALRRLIISRPLSGVSKSWRLNCPGVTIWCFGFGHHTRLFIGWVVQWFVLNDRSVKRYL